MVGFDRPRFFSVVRPDEGMQYHREQENGEVENSNALAWRAWL